MASCTHCACPLSLSLLGVDQFGDFLALDCARQPPIVSTAVERLASRKAALAATRFER